MAKHCDHEDEFNALRARIAGLEHELSLMRARLPPMRRPAPQPEERPTLTQVRPRAPEGPTIEQAKVLVQMVAARFPEARPRHVDVDVLAEQTRNCIVGLSIIGRRDTVDNDKFPGFWVDEIESVLKAYGHSNDIGGSLLLSVIACGDIPFAVAKYRAPVFGLARGGRPSQPRWRDILAGTTGLPNPWPHPDGDARQEGPSVVSMRDPIIVP